MSSTPPVQLVISNHSRVEIALPVASLEPMVHFYHQILGLQLYGWTGLGGVHITGFEFGESILKLADFTQAENKPEPKQPNLENGFLTMKVRDVKIVEKRCEKEGARILEGVKEIELENGRKIQALVLADPMGNVVEVVEGEAYVEL